MSFGRVIKFMQLRISSPLSVLGNSSVGKDVREKQPSIIKYSSEDLLHSSRICRDLQSLI